MNDFLACERRGILGRPFFSYKLTYGCIVDSIKFQLEEGGDLVWMMSSALEQETLPFFSCETFMVCNILLSS